MAVREGDPLTTGHACDGITNLAISLKRTVKANGIVCAVQGTPTVTHLVPPIIPPCSSHIANLNAGSPTVKIIIFLNREWYADANMISKF